MSITFGHISNREAHQMIFGNDKPATGYVTFKARDWSFAGDKGTWARRNDNGTITVKRASRGTLSRAYRAELCEFCAEYGQDFDSIVCGNSITFTV